MDTLDLIATAVTTAVLIESRVNERIGGQNPDSDVSTAEFDRLFGAAVLIYCAQLQSGRGF